MADRSSTLLRQLRADMAGWFGVIQRAVGVPVEVRESPDGEFWLKVTWKGLDGTHSYERQFSKEFVFGQSLSSPMACRIQKRPCDYAKDFMREVLAQRGVL